MVAYWTGGSHLQGFVPDGVGGGGLLPGSRLMNIEYVLLDGVAFPRLD